MITVNVTEEDIKEGIKEDCWRCPIARAINRALPDGWVCDVSNYKVTLIKNLCPVEVHPLPWVARGFISMFDSGNVVEPITFELPFTP